MASPKGNLQSLFALALAMASAYLSRFARFYNSNFDRRPIPTLIITNGILYTISDVCAQSSEMYMNESPQPYDPERTLRLVVFGMGMGPLIGRWMRLIERNIPMRPGKPGNNLQLAKRVLADQTIMAPIGLVLFVSTIGFMEGKNTQEIKQKFSDVFVPAMIANWKVWPLIQAVNFKLMPLPYRVPFQSTCGIAWVLYLSLLNARQPKSSGDEVINETDT